MKKTFTLFSICSILFIAPVSLVAALSSKPVAVASATKPTPEEVTNALRSFSELSKKEQKERLKTAKETARKYKENLKETSAADESTILLAILAILLPPLAVYLKEGDLTTNFWVSVILSLLFWVPGVIFALLVVLDVI